MFGDWQFVWIYMNSKTLMIILSHLCSKFVQIITRSGRARGSWVGLQIGFHFDVFVGNILIRFYGEYSGVNHAEKIQ